MKKIGAIILAALVGAGMMFSAAGCGSEEECVHDVGTWEVVTQSTCVRMGMRQGICGICLKTVSEILPVDSTAHAYGEWAVNKLPTETETGSATKICTAQSSHVLTIDLPTLGDTSYASSITQRPTAAKDGVRTYTLKHDEGNVSFTQSVPAAGVQTLRDAVDLGAAEESRALIRSAEGRMGYEFYNGQTQTASQSQVHEHSYEFGNGYTHIVDGTDNCERWYFTDKEGELYGLTDFSDGTTTGVIRNDLDSSSGNKKYFQGSRLYLQYANGLGSFYGVESLLEGMYRAARWGDNDDFQEWTEERDGEVVYAFSFGSVENSGSASGYFANVKTEFTLTPSFTIATLKVEATIYVNNSAQDGDAIKTWDLNEEGNAYVIEGKENGTRYVSIVEFSQTMKAAEDVVPQNPHSLDTIFVQSFDVYYHGEVLGEGDYAEFAAGESVNTGYVFSVGNVQPAGVLENYKMDSFKFYLRTKNDAGETVDVPLGGTIGEVGMTAYMKEDYTFFLRAQRAGEQTIVLKTRFAEKEIHCKISEEAPSHLYPTVYQYTNGEYEWEYATSRTIKKTVYTNQPFYFTADVSEEQKNYTSPSHKLEITKSGDSKFDATEYLTSEAIGVKSVHVFTPQTKGTYTLKMTSVFEDTTQEKVYCAITLTVKTAPTIPTLVAKEYEQNLEYAPPEYQPSKVTVTFADLQEVTDEQQTLTGYTFTATITLGDGSVQVLRCSYDLEERQLTSAHSSGVSDYGFILAINEANDFVLSHYDGFDDWENVVLREKTAAEGES